MIGLQHLEYQKESCFMTRVIYNMIGFSPLMIHDMSTISQQLMRTWEDLELIINPYKDGRCRALPGAFFWWGG